MGKCNICFKFTPYRPRAENVIYLSLACQAKLSASPDLPFFLHFSALVVRADSPIGGWKGWVCRLLQVYNSFELDWFVRCK